MKRLAILVFCVLWTTGAAHAGGRVLLQRLSEAVESEGIERARDMGRGVGLLLREEDGRTLVPLIVSRDEARSTGLTRALSALGGRIDASSRSYTRILIPLPHLLRLQQAMPNVAFRTPVPAKTHFGTGGNVSQSVALVGADGYQAGNLDGSGVRVAVIDLGFSGLTNALNQGELPSGACNGARSLDFTGTGLQAATQHGTGVAEHVADMAPGAEIYCLRVGDEVDLQNAADYLRDNNIDIANHSVGWVIASYYDGSGPISDIVNQSFDNDGVFWTLSAGNDARRHWRGGWVDSDGDSDLEFSGTDERMALQGGATTVTVFLNWNQYGVNNKTDLNLYIYDKNGNLVAASTVRQSRFNEPAEAVSFPAPSSGAPYSIRVRHAGGSTAGLDITLFSFTHNFEYPVVTSSMMDPAVAHGAFALGAVNQSNWQNANPAVRSYSSRGPTTDGRIKPELVAPDGTSSLTYPTASGTSFSAPTTAGAAALLLQEDPARSATDLGDTLIANAIDIGAAGVDSTSGAGKLQLPAIDTDGDGLSNGEELDLGTDPLLADTDSDGLNDFDEVNYWSTDPLIADSDGDLLEDGEEVSFWGSDPLLPDSDDDGLDDGYEALTYGTDPSASNVGDLAPRGAPDNQLNAGDYLVLTRLVSGLLSASGGEQTLGDLNDSGTLDTGDLVLLMRVLQGEIAPP